LEFKYFDTSCLENMEALQSGHYDKNSASDEVENSKFRIILKTTYKG